MGSVEKRTRLQLSWDEELVVERTGDKTVLEISVKAASYISLNLSEEARLALLEALR